MATTKRRQQKPTKTNRKRARPKTETTSQKPPIKREKRITPEEELRAHLGRGTAAPILYDEAQREQVGLSRDPTKADRYLVELNLEYTTGLGQAATNFKKLFRDVLEKRNAEFPPQPVSKSYFKCLMSANDWQQLIYRDEVNSNGDRRKRLIYKIWPDFRVRALIDRSISTVKADAAVRAYSARGTGIVWAVIDSGVDANHIHFGGPETLKKESANDRKTRLATHTLLAPSVAELHRDFTELPEAKEEDRDASIQRPGGALSDKARARNIKGALSDGFGHGTHVAGIIAGGLGRNGQKRVPIVFERVFSTDKSGSNLSRELSRRVIPDTSALRGVAPDCKLISLKVLGEDGEGYTSDVMRALEYVREELNGDPKLLRVHGVNLSLGYEFDAEMFACGQSPLCVEVDRLVRSGVVVVVAAGNTGYGKLNSDQRLTRVGLSNTINDPGNAALAITVGATHRDAPHTYGVSYFSSKGPTGDGRLKPDLVAPGERITSCTAGRQVERLGGERPTDTSVCYVDDSGTSMAAPHVSGAIAALLSIRREFIQKPEDVKRIFLSTTTSLGRERYFEGNGLIDLMRAIQSV